MIIIQKRAGQLGNQLFQLAHFAALAAEHEIQVLCPAFEYPLAIWPNINSSATVRVIQGTDFSHKLIHRCLKMLRIISKNSRWHECLVENNVIYNMNTPEFSDIAHKSIVACEGFGFRAVNSVGRQICWLRNLFEMSDEIKNNVSNFEQKNDLLKKMKVGFHIRRGDYRDYRGCVYFHDDNTWLKWIHQARSILGENQCDFVGILFSNEKIDELAESGDDVIRAPGDIYEDLLMLQRCDYILGPPSTFSGWASFIGRVPLLQLLDKDMEINRTDFRIVEW